MFLKSEIGTDCTDRRKADSSNYSHLINLYLRCSDLIGREIENLGRRQKINRTHFQNVVKHGISHTPHKNIGSAKNARVTRTLTKEDVPSADAASANPVIIRRPANPITARIRTAFQ